MSLINLFNKCIYQKSKVLYLGQIQNYRLLADMLHQNCHNFLNIQATVVIQISKDCQRPWQSFDIRIKSIVLVLRKLLMFLEGLSASIEKL